MRIVDSLMLTESYCEHLRENLIGKDSNRFSTVLISDFMRNFKFYKANNTNYRGVEPIIRGILDLASTFNFGKKAFKIDEVNKKFACSSILSSLLVNSFYYDDKLNDGYINFIECNNCEDAIYKFGFSDIEDLKYLFEHFDIEYDELTDENDGELNVLDFAIKHHLSLKELYNFINNGCE